ncbi:hypothetical protein FACS189441_4990 [Betaproteobacteria bacterium]|nr:hypothetical protein FACS189441_4990 [Betaproteobacteria bacterium]GHU54312.1 hypothetical protein FACS189411_00780 [Bacteroidia bacterium]
MLASEKKYNFATLEQEIMKLFANIISTAFHPLLMVTYGTILALSFTYLAIFPMMLKLYLLAGVVLCTVLIPSVVVYLMVKSGAAGDLDLTDRRERVIPYLMFITGNMLCFFYLSKMQMPVWALTMFTGASVALFIALLINFVWKISAHAIGIGGLLGAIMGVAHSQLMNPYWLFIAVFIVAGLVGTSRIILEKHTPMQVYAGFVLGFLCTFGASFMNIIYLLIH